MVQQTELSTEIDRCFARNRRLRPKLIGVEPRRTGILKVFGDSNPVFQIETETTTGHWKIQRSYLDFATL